MQSSPLVFMFSGQGSHYYGMAAGLFRHEPVFRRWMLELDGLMRRATGESAVEQIYAAGKSAGDPFTRTRISHPALFMVQFALARALEESHGIRPDAVIGASLGEFVAAAVTGALPPESAFAAVLAQAESLEAHCAPGSMTAVLAGEALLRDPEFRDAGEIAGVNFAGHFVVSAPAGDMPRIHARLQAGKVSYFPLAVSQAFHSRWIEPAAAAFLERTIPLPWATPRIPWVSCCAGRLGRVPADHLWGAVRRPMDFPSALRALESGPEACYLDLGPTGTLATFAKYNFPQGGGPRCLSVLTPFGAGTPSLEGIVRSLRAAPARASASV